MKRIVLISLLLNLASAAFAQISDFKKMYSHEIRISVVSEGGITALAEFEEGIKSSTTYFTFASVVFDPKFRLKSFDDKASISVSLPISAGMKVFEVFDASLVTSIGIYGDYNIGKNATFNNIDRIGFSFGAGLDYTRISAIDYETTVNMISPAIRIGINTLVNSRTNKTIITVFKFGIPYPYDFGPNNSGLANLFGGVSVKGMIF